MEKGLINTSASFFQFAPKVLLCKTFAVLFSPLVLSFIFANYVFYDSKVSRAKVLLLSEAIVNRFYFLPEASSDPE